MRAAAALRRCCLSAAAVARPLRQHAVAPRATAARRGMSTVAAAVTMPPLVTKTPAELVLVAGAAPAAGAATHVLLGSKGALLEPATVALVPAALASVYSAMVDAAAGGSPDAGGTASAFVPPAADGAQASRFVVAVLPDKCSRHNTPSQAHAVTALVGAAVSGAGDVAVTVAAPPAHALATAAAVARAFPLFSAKSRKAGAAAEPAAPQRVTLGFHSTGAALSPAALAALTAAADGVRLAARLVDTPPEQMDTTAFRAEAARVAQALGPSVRLQEIVGAELAAQGFGGLWGVGKAAAAPPALVVLSYEPPNAGPDTQTVALVGKGIVYDTGGLSLKVGGGMVGMKMDCGGAAAMLATFSSAVRAGATQRLHLVCCLAENAIGPGALRNDDIITLYSGKTVEINNTDAEGRLVLGDGVAYATKHLSPHLVIDMATLTGAQLVATGKRHAAVVSNRDDLEAAAIAAGRASGDLVAPLPFAPEFFRAEFKSTVADMRNSVKDRSNAQSSCAAIFVAEHLGADYAGGWLHVDIAGPAWVDSRGTGYGVALLLALLQPPALAGTY